MGTKLKDNKGKLIFMVAVGLFSLYTLPNTPESDPTFPKPDPERGTACGYDYQKKEYKYEVKQYRYSRPILFPHPTEKGKIPQSYSQEYNQDNYQDIDIDNIIDDIESNQ